MEGWREELVECFFVQKNNYREKFRKAIYASIFLKCISEYYLYCFCTIKNGMDGRGMIELVGDSWCIQNSEGSPSRLCWQFQYSLKDNEVHESFQNHFKINYLWAHFSIILNFFGKWSSVHMVLIYFLGITGFLGKLSPQCSQFCWAAVCQQYKLNFAAFSKRKFHLLWNATLNGVNAAM